MEIKIFRKDIVTIFCAVPKNNADKILGVLLIVGLLSIACIVVDYQFTFF
jgi:hypothetical protein